MGSEKVVALDNINFEIENDLLLAGHVRLGQINASESYGGARKPTRKSK